MRSLVMRTTIPPPPDEVVEDSEPEREQRRLAERAKRKTKRKATAPTSEKRVVMISSDSDTPVSKSASPAVQRQRDEIVHNSVIEISDDEPAYDWDNRGLSPRPHAISSKVNHNVLSLVPNQDEAFEDTTAMPSVREIIGLPRRTSSASSSGGSVELPPLTGTEVLPTRPSSREPSPPLGRSGSRVLDIARFAYAGSQRTMSSRAPSLAPSRATPAVEPPKATKQSRASSNKPTGISDADVGKLRRCVCCELAWTTRKTAPQKLKHIHSCAKKHQILPDTLQHLLRAEIERLKQLPPEESSKKGKGKLLDVPLEPEQPGTLLETALDGGAKKKPGPRRKVIESVKELHETRQNILDRAKQLLGGSAKPATIVSEEEDALSRSPPRTQPFEESRLARRYVPTTILEQTQIPIHVPDYGLAGPSRRTLVEDDDTTLSPPRTQPFDESTLAKKFGKTRALDSGLNDKRNLSDASRIQDGSPSRSPPQTQPFGESALTKHFGNARAQPTSLLDAEELDSPPQSPQAARRHIFNEVSNSSPPRRAAVLGSDDSDVEIADGPLPAPSPASPSPASHSSNARGPRSPSAVQNRPRATPPSRSESPVPALDGFAWEDVGEWEPNAGGALEEYYYDDYGHDDAVIHYNPTDDMPAATPPSPQRMRRSASPTRPPKVTNTVAKPRKSAKKKKDAAGAEVALTDAELHAQLCACVERDTALYHRVLRYEPVHFDVFLALATGLGAPARGLKLRVRDFLDRQAIHFYGLDATTERTKRRRA